MRHTKKNNHLGRTATHRAAMLSNMAASLLTHKRITTTLAKAKELRKYIEPLITRGKEDTTHSRRVVFSYLQNKFAVSELFREISQKVGERPGGYTRILKTGFRKGDNAEMCIIELVDYNETYNTGDEKKKTTKTRRGRGKAKIESGAHEGKKVDSKKADSINVEKVVVEEPVVEEPVVEEPVVEEIAIEELPAEELSEEIPAEEPATETSEE
ncbi:MAG: 50S ribosomal protein L17 [Bacteroidales bacterium]|jgi:large subunit ribosomal protein L17|nr:50S ribosomal protein L17 [Bacteroidales bacterium]